MNRRRNYIPGLILAIACALQWVSASAAPAGLKELNDSSAQAPTIYSKADAEMSNLVSNLSIPLQSVRNSKEFRSLQIYSRSRVNTLLRLQLHVVEPSDAGSKTFLHVASCLKTLELINKKQFLGADGASFYSVDKTSKRYQVASLPDQQFILAQWGKYLLLQH